MESYSACAVLLLILLVHLMMYPCVMSLPELSTWLQYCENTTDDVTTKTCRTRHGLLHSNDYIVCSCVECYVYLFQKEFLFPVLPDPDQQSTMDSACSSLSRKDCKRWTACCLDARACCTRLQGITASGKFCPGTWDGFSCVNASSPGQDVHIPCPGFMGSSKQQAVKICTPNGTWWREPAYHREWTNYSTCVEVDLPAERAAQIVGIVCNSLSIAFLVTAIAIFIGFRQIRHQRHVKLHINLSVALLMASVTSLLMEKLVYLDELYIGDRTEFFQVKYETACKVINILDLLFQMCPAFWMLCEGFYLSWLMLRAFQPLTRMTSLYLFGWGAPILIVTIYTLLISNMETSVCWLTDSTGIQWMIYGPTIACIAVNLVLFLVILVVMAQLQSHPREPSNFRRVLKATVILIPLFGLQQFCIIYSPASTVPGFVIYNIARKIIIHSQGLLVALIFCFCNNEVHNQVSAALKKWRQGTRHSSRSITMTSASTLTLHRPSLPEVIGTDIALGAMGNQQNTAFEDIADISS